MAVIEFFKIRLMDRDNKEKKMDFSKLCKDRLQNMTDSEKYCTHSSCDASMVDYIENEDSITFDFIKFKKEIIHSTIISEPGDEQDTFEALNTNIIDSIKYTKDDLKTVKKIIKKEFIPNEQLFDKVLQLLNIFKNDGLEIISSSKKTIEKTSQPIDDSLDFSHFKVNSFKSIDGLEYQKQMRNE